MNCDYSTYKICKNFFYFLNCITQFSILRCCFGSFAWAFYASFEYAESPQIDFSLAERTFSSEYAFEVAHFKPSIAASNLPVSLKISALIQYFAHKTWWRTFRRLYFVITFDVREVYGYCQLFYATTVAGGFVQSAECSVGCEARANIVNTWQIAAHLCFKSLKIFA